VAANVAAKVYLGDCGWHRIANTATVVERQPVLADIELASRFGKQVNSVLVALGSDGPLAVALCNGGSIELTIVIRGDYHDGH